MPEKSRIAAEALSDRDGKLKNPWIPLLITVVTSTQLWHHL